MSSKVTQDSQENVLTEGIAIIGMAFRFPGGLSDQASMWQSLVDGKDCITQIPLDRWPTDTLQHNERAEPGRSVTYSAGVVPHIDQFDASFFGISPREATWLDPQQRLLLEMAYEAMENSGMPSTALAGTNCGVFVGISSLDYGLRALEDLASMSSHSMTGNTMSIAANRISYVFDLHGPSMAIDTACSSSLVALHYACNALRAGEIPVALVGGVNVLMHPYSFVGFSKASMLSSYGRCLPFDEKAGGYVRAEGGAVLLLKPLSQALADKDHIDAVILASGVNADGKRKTGITIPSIEGQMELMQSVLATSGIDPHDVDFIEAHGTGTSIGDPIETKAIGNVYAQGRKNPLPISSVKANLGHLEPASGMAGLVKTVLALKNRSLPPSPFKVSANPKIDFAALNLRYLEAHTPLHNDKGQPLTAGLNAFGFGGANAHVLLREFRPMEDTCPKSCESTALPPLFLSARSEGALKDLAQRYAERLAGMTTAEFYNFANSAAFHRNHLEKRVALQATSPAEAAQMLQNFAAGESNSGLYREDAQAHQDGIAFIYAGNGAQWTGMARTLLEQSPDFACILEKLDAAMLAPAGFSIIEALRDDAEDLLNETAVSQPLLFAIQVALTMLLREQGISPKAVMGHSVGEIAAAWASGALDMDQAIHVICARSQAQSLTAGQGRMAVAGLSEAETQNVLCALGLADAIEIAGINAPANVTLSGSVEALHALQAHLESKGVFYRLLGLNYAFHSKYMDGIRDVLAEKLQGLAPSDSSSAIFVSSVTGLCLDGKELTAAYWWENVRRPVRFAAAMESLLQKDCGIFVEISPHAILQRYVKDCAKAAAKNVCVIPTLMRNDDSPARITQAVLRTHMAANNTLIKVFFPHEAKRVDLPTYAWQKERYWYKRTSEAMAEKRRIHPLLGWALDGGEPSWENVLDPTIMPWLEDHKVGEAIIFPGAGYVELALAAARAWLGEKQFSLECLDIVAPLVFDGSTAQSLRVLINTRDASFKIMARPRLSEGQWMLHATGRILTTAPQQPTTAILPVEENSRQMKGEELYAHTLALGLDYGPVFRRIAQLSIGDSHLEAQLKEQDFDTEGFVLHPALLDACFHSLVALYAKHTGQTTSAYLPVKTGHITVFSQHPVCSIRVQALRQGLRSLSAHCELLDTAGLLVARASMCRFRAAPLTGKGKTQAGIWHTVARVKPHPQAEATSHIPPVEELHHWLEQALYPYEDTRRTWFNHILPLLEAMTLSFAYTAFRSLANDKSKNWHNDLRSPYAQWLARLLRQEELLEIDENGWHLASQSDFTDPQELWQSLLHEHPESLPQLLLLGRVGMRLEHVLRSQCDASVLRQEICAASVTKELRNADPAYTGTSIALKAVLRSLAAHLPPARRLRVLELGIKPDDMVTALTTKLSDDRFIHMLACCDSEALHAELTRHAHSTAFIGTELDARQWNLQHPIAAQNSFDVVIVNHVLHKTAHLQKALNHLQDWLAPGGLLLLAERHADWSTCLVEGLDQEWWRQECEIPLLAPETWQQILEEKGFEQCRIFTESTAEELAEGAYLLLAKNPAKAVIHEEMPCQSWLLLVDAQSQNLAETLQCSLEAQGHRVHLSFDTPDTSHQNFAHIIYMRGANSKVENTADSLNDLLTHVRHAAQRKEASRFWIVTTGGVQCANLPAQYISSPLQCALWGAGRVIMNEYTDLHCTLLDVDASAPAHSVAQWLEREFLFPDGADEIMLTPSGRHVLTLDESSLKNPFDAANNTERFRLDFNVPGRLNNLAWFADSPRTLAADEIEARTMAVGLNFRDVMLTMGLLPDDAVESGFAGPTLGLEFSGIVTKVGHDVEHVKPGDAVVGFAPSCFASHVVMPMHSVAHMPAHWSHEAAATVPTVFFTAYYALKHLAQMQPGEKLLVHGAAGGIGLASIQIARHLGLEVFATAGSEEKRDLIRLQGVQHVFDSRSLNFADQILELTKGEGVDAVLNSLAGEAMRRSLALLRPFGRFLELGKRDFVENTPVGVRPFKENISYFAIDADQLLTGRPQLAGKVFQEVMDLFHDGVLTPLPRRVFGVDQVVDAFRAMQQSRHVGKIVVSLDEAAPQQILAVTSQKLHQWTTAGTWLISGGVAGLGLATAQWLGEHGATHLVLLGRRGMDSPNAQEIINDFANKNITARIEACDVNDAKAVRELVQRIHELTPLQGVVHAAAVYDDRMIAQLDAQSLHKVLGPKLSGAWNLHEATLHIPLEHFIVYSSVSVALGNPGQLNYVAANAALEGLTLLRSQMQLPATCVAWGPMGDVGYLTRHEKVKKGLEQHLGGEALASKDALKYLEQLTMDREGVHTLANVNWAMVRRMMPHTTASRYSLLFHRAEDAHAGDASDTIHARIAGKKPEEVMAIVCALLMDEVAQVLSLNVERITKGSTLQSLGMDSLMAVELAVGLEQSFGVRLPAMMLQDSPTIEKVATRILDRLGKQEEEPVDANDNAAEIARIHGVELSTDDMTAMVEGAQIALSTQEKS